MKLADSALRAGFRLNAFESLTSTNDEALRRAALGERDRLWVVAASQTGGRGRQGRAWSSPPGNLYASLLLVDRVPPPLAPQLGFVASVALADAVERLVGPGPALALKWPNDLLADGRKLAGILVEGTRVRSGRFAAVLGFGVNRSSHPEGLAYPVTDLFALGPARPSLDDLMVALSASIDETLNVWDEGRRFDLLRARWLSRALPPGTPIAVSTDQRRRTGTFETIDERGRLILATADGSIPIDAGDVFLMDRPMETSG